MADSYSGKVQLWEGWLPSMTKGPPSSPFEDRYFLGRAYRRDYADRLYAGETFNSNGPGRESAEPFSLQWFLDIDNARRSRQCYWIPRMLEFVKHGGETLLGLGHGLGTDWIQYARHGADVIACCPSNDQLVLIQRNFALRGLNAVFLHADPTSIPLETASIDVACVANLLENVADPTVIIEEIYRLLKPGGKVLAVLPARFDLDFWCRRFLPWHSLLSLRSKSYQKDISYSARMLRQLFGRFVEVRVYKRHLRRSEVPHLWRWLPRPLLERLLGRLLILKAFKPLSAAISVPLAA